MRLKLIGAFGERNFGDDLLLDAAARLIAGALPVRRLGVAATVPQQSGYIRRIVPGAHIVARVRPLPARWDAEIFAGGNQFYSFPAGRGDVGAGGTLARMRARLRDEGAAHFLARHALRRLLPAPRGFAVGIGIGPFEHGNEAASRRVVAGLERIWIRDERSKADLMRWGLDNYSEGADLCFASGALRVPARAAADDTRAPRRIGVVMRGWDYRTAGARYEETLIALVGQLRAGGCEVSLFAFCEPADRAVIEGLRRCGEAIAVWDPETMTVADYLSCLKDCELLLSTRFHGVVVAALLGVPVIGLALDPKVRGLCARLGLGDFVWDGVFDPEKLRALLRDAAEQRGAMRARMAQAVRIERLRADAMLAEVIEQLRAV